MYYGLPAQQSGRTVNFRSISLWNFQETQKNLFKQSQYDPLIAKGICPFKGAAGFEDI